MVHGFPRGIPALTKIAVAREGHCRRKSGRRLYRQGVTSVVIISAHVVSGQGLLKNREAPVPMQQANMHSL